MIKNHGLKTGLKYAKKPNSEYNPRIIPKNRDFKAYL